MAIHIFTFPLIPWMQNVLTRRCDESDGRITPQLFSWLRVHSSARSVGLGHFAAARVNHITVLLKPVSACCSKLTTPTADFQQ